MAGAVFAAVSQLCRLLCVHDDGSHDFYSFSAMMNDRLLTQRVQQDIRIDGVLGFGSTIVAVVVLFFMLSANHFFLNQRQKEISVYQLLGLRRAKLSWLLLRETFLLNLFFPCCGHFHGDYIFEIFLNDLDSSDGTIHH